MLLRTLIDNNIAEIKEPEMPQPESVPNQFAKRAIYELMVDDESERVVESFWPVLPSGDEAEQEIEQVITYYYTYMLT